MAVLTWNGAGAMVHLFQGHSRYAAGPRTRGPFRPARAEAYLSETNLILRPASLKKTTCRCLRHQPFGSRGKERRAAREGAAEDRPGGGSQRCPGPAAGTSLSSAVVATTEAPCRGR